MAKEKKNKLPKKIAGVKVPKELRNAGKVAQSFAKQPIVSELVAAALTAAATSLTAQSKAGRSMAKAAGDAGEEAVKATSAIGAGVRRALLDAARDMLDGLEGKPKTSGPKAGGGNAGPGRSGPSRSSGGSKAASPKTASPKAAASRKATGSKARSSKANSKTKR